jgi:CheY-like chemotaxis protein
MAHTVVVIDDSDTDLLYARIMLERTGAVGRLVTFESARDALAWLGSPEAREVSMILLDINMPGMDGFEFLDAYEAQRADPAMVVMLTSSPDPTDRVRAQRHACVRAYVTKPIDLARAQALCRTA